MIGSSTVYNIYFGREFLCYTTSLRTAKTKAREMGATAIVEIELDHAQVSCREHITIVTQYANVWQPDMYGEWRPSDRSCFAQMFDGYY